MKQRAGTMFRQMAETNARDIADRDRAHELALRAVETRRLVIERACMLAHLLALNLSEALSVDSCVVESLTLAETKPWLTPRWRSNPALTP